MKPQGQVQGVRRASNTKSGLIWGSDSEAKSKTNVLFPKCNKISGAHEVAA